MAVYVDNAAVPARGKKWFHMTADTLAELHAFAARIGLKRCWFESGRHKHYDVTAQQRQAAIEAGALAVRSREVVLACRRLQAALDAKTRATAE